MEEAVIDPITVLDGDLQTWSRKLVGITVVTPTWTYSYCRGGLNDFRRLLRPALKRGEAALLLLFWKASARSGSVWHIKLFEVAAGILPLDFSVVDRGAVGELVYFICFLETVLSAHLLLEHCADAYLGGLLLSGCVAVL